MRVLVAGDRGYTSAPYWSRSCEQPATRLSAWTSVGTTDATSVPNLQDTNNGMAISVM